MIFLKKKLVSNIKKKVHLNFNQFNTFKFVKKKKDKL